MKRRFSRIIAVVLISVALNPLALKAQGNADEAAIKNLVEQFFVAHQKRDLDGMMACWSAKSPQFTSIKQSVQSELAQYDETQYMNVTFSQWKIDTNRASVRLRYEVKRRDVRTKQPFLKTFIVNLAFVREADGWKFSEKFSARTALAIRLFEAKTKEERSELLKSNGDLVTTELVTVFCESAEQRVEHNLFDEALKLSDISLEVAEVTGESVDKGQCYLTRGFIYYRQSKYSEAIANYQHALQLFKAAQDKRWEATTLNHLGELYIKENKREEAVKQYEASLKLMRETNDKEGEVKALGNIGLLYKFMSKHAEALAANESGLGVARDIGDKQMEIGFRIEIGIIYNEMSRYGEAIEYFKTTLQLIRTRGGSKSDEATALNDLGSVYRATGKYAEALECYGAVLKMLPETEDKRLEGIVLNNIGIIYSLTGRFEEALEKYKASLELKRAITDRQGESATLNSIGNIYQYTGRYPEALEQYQQSLEIKRVIGDKAGEAVVLNNIGLVYQLTHKYVKASENYKEAFHIRQDMGDIVGESRIVSNLAIIYQLAGEYDEAQLLFHEILKTMRHIGDWLGEANTLTNIGEAYRSQEKWQEAADAYRQALTVIERIRAETKEPSLQTSFFSVHTSSYYGLIECLLELGSGRDEILTVSERAKARTLVEMMTGGKVNILKSMTGAEQKREQDLNANIIAATAQLNAALSSSPIDQQGVDTLIRQLNQARSGYDEFRRQLFIAHPELQAQRANFDPLTLAQLGETLFARNHGLCLLSYVVSKDKTLLFVITGGKKARSPATLKVYTLKVDKDQELTAAELNHRLMEFRRRYTHESGLYKTMARDLYNLLLAPAEKDIAGKSHVVIIPDRILHALPFQALMNRQEKHFIESHTISYAPSITSLVQMMKLADRKKKTNTNTKPLFAMGRRTFPDQAQYRNSELRGAEKQVKSIADLFAVNPLIGTDATKAKAKLEMSKARYVHFATHGELNEVAPMYSAIVLGKSADDDGMLYARELVDMDLRAELVVLSACDTGMGQSVNGEGIVGLTWALFVAGTPSSVVTQWKVRDDSMNKLMLEFYRQMRLATTKGQQPISKAEALRRAQLSLMKDAAYKHPYYWAPVTLVGDWR